MEKHAQKVEKKPLGVVEVLTNGFELIWRNPWILLVPIALDFFLWLGPQINAQPLFQRASALLAVALLADTSPETMQTAQMLQDTLRAAGDSINIVGVLAIGMPTVIGLQPPEANVARARLVVGDGIVLLGWVALLGLGSVLVMGSYLEMTARAVRNEVGMRSFIAQWLRACVDVIGLTILVATGLMMLMIPMTIIVSVLNAVSQGLGAFLLLSGMLLIFWVMLYLVFAVPAIFVSRANAAQAVINSISVFRFDFWSAIGLVLIVYIVRTGFSFIWQCFGSNPWGIVFDVIANAFLSSGLIAAEMIFYNDRMYWLATGRARMQPQQKV